MPTTPHPISVVPFLATIEETAGDLGEYVWRQRHGFMASKSERAEMALQLRTMADRIEQTPDGAR